MTDSNFVCSLCCKCFMSLVTVLSLSPFLRGLRLECRIMFTCGVRHTVPSRYLPDNSRVFLMSPNKFVKLK